MNKLLSLVNLFRKGEAVANKEAWKKGQIGVTAVAGAIVAAVQVAKAFGYSLPEGITEDTINYVSAGIIGVVNIALTYATSEKVGLLPSK